MITARDWINDEEKSFSDLLLDNLKMNGRIEDLESLLKRVYELEYIDGEWVDDYHKLMENKQ